MKRIEKYEEFKKIWMLYINERATEKDCEYYFKNQLMLMTTDGLVLLLDKKQSIRFACYHHQSNTHKKTTYRQYLHKLSPIQKQLLIVIN